MKTLLFGLSIVLSVISLNGQQDSVLTNKKGHPVLPEKQDIAIGISVNSIFNYLGNTFNGSEYNSLHLSLLNNSQLYGKYYLTHSSALRVRFGITMTNEQILISLTNAEPSVFEEEYSSFYLSTGYERRLGSNRLQISYGGEFSVSYSEVDYDIDSRFIDDVTESQRLRQGDGFGIGMRGFLGMEYFLIPKLSVGGECGIGLTGSGLFPDKYKTKILVNTDILGGQIYMLFHFGL